MYSGKHLWNAFVWQCIAQCVLWYCHFSCLPEERVCDSKNYAETEVWKTMWPSTDKDINQNGNGIEAMDKEIEDFCTVCPRQTSCN